jgi:hypothetical protein
MNGLNAVHGSGSSKGEETMKKLAVFGSLWISVLVPQVKAQGCFNNALQGVYSFVPSATILSVKGSHTGPVVVYDGNGATGRIETILTGTIVTCQRSRGFSANTVAPTARSGADRRTTGRTI